MAEEVYWKHRTLATAVLVGVIGFLYPLMQVFLELKSWEGAWEQPALAGKLIWCLICGLMAMAAAMGLNIGNLLRGVGINVGVTTPTVNAPTIGV